MKSECGSCGEIFNSVSSFDKHRIGSFGEAIYKKSKSREIIGYTKHARRCLTPAEMIALGMSKNERGWWITSAYDAKAHSETEDELEEIEENAEVS